MDCEVMVAPPCIAKSIAGNAIAPVSRTGDQFKVCDALEMEQNNVCYLGHAVEFNMARAALNQCHESSNVVDPPDDICPTKEGREGKQS